MMPRRWGYGLLTLLSFLYTRSARTAESGREIPLPRELSEPHTRSSMRAPRRQPRLFDPSKRSRGQLAKALARKDAARAPLEHGTYGGRGDRSVGNEIHLRELVPTAVKGTAETGRRKKAALRRLAVNRTACSSHSQCGENEYCMSCAQCVQYHASLSPQEQLRWTCDPCGVNETHCESGRYCEVAHDAVDGQCPSFPGCSSHAECGTNEYCFSCEQCLSRARTNSGSADLWECQPCPTSKGGFCGKTTTYCASRNDSVTGVCPEIHGCAEHSDCGANQYCESCQYCLEFQQSLPAASRSRWPCHCPTIEGGVCEAIRFCQHANDGVHRTCPMATGCSSHMQCRPDEYCMSCENCSAYHATLTGEAAAGWNCGLCPTQRNGDCEYRQYCPVAADAIGGGECPEFRGCSAHEDCLAGQFCLSWRECEAEVGGGNCGTRPSLGGLCISGRQCTPRRSINGSCFGGAPCDRHYECPADEFCTNWMTCEARSPGACGRQHIHSEGVCLDSEHCIRGLHAPVDGSCPAPVSQEVQLRSRRVLHLEGSTMLAIHHQAFNVWAPESSLVGERVVAQLHDYGAPNASDYVDDVEYVGIYRAATAGSSAFWALIEEKRVQLSCPRVEVSVPAIGGHFYEARPHVSEFDMTTTHRECSCIRGRNQGECPRGVAYRTQLPQATPDGIHSGCNSFTRSLQNYTSAEHIDLDFLASGVLDFTLSCSGFLDVDTNVEFSLRSNGSLIEQSTISYYRLDTYERETHTFTGLTNLTFNGRSLTCHPDRSISQACGGLPADVPVPVVLIHMTSSGNDGDDNMSGNAYCVRCWPTLDRLYPVVFKTSLNERLANNITLYSLKSDVRVRARLVDSSLVGGEGDASLGCDQFTNPDIWPTFQQLRERGKVLPDGHVTGLWCVVRDGSCSITAKYKLCVLGGARGVLIVQAAPPNGEAPDRGVVGEIYLAPDESLEDMVPAIYASQTGLNGSLWSALQAGIADVEIFAGPSVGVKPPPGFQMSLGGVRHYNVQTEQWRSHHADTFATVRWMEHSPVRNVLFVCTDDQRVLALNTSHQDEGMPIIAEIGFHGHHEACRSEAMLRDYHMADLRIQTDAGNRFVSVFVDATDRRNHLLFIDTTDLTAPISLAEVHANWEHDLQGMGQVVATPDSRRILISWHCSTRDCRPTLADTATGQRPGERIYVLDLTNGLLQHNAPQVLGIINLPMEEGSVTRDVACDTNGICLATLSGDGIAALDIEDGPNRLRVVSSHSETFIGEDFEEKLTGLGQQNSWLRTYAGAQRVKPSVTTPGRFYVERWGLDLDCVRDAGSSCLRFDSVYAVSLEGYDRPEAVMILDPAVHAVLELAVPWADLLNALPNGLAGLELGEQADALERMIAACLRQALGVPATRIVVTQAVVGAYGESARVHFHILPANDGASPDTLYRMLERQLVTTGSAISHGPLGPFISRATLRRTLPNGMDFQDPSSESTENNESHSSVLVLTLLLLVALVFGIGALAVIGNLRRRLRLVQAQVSRDPPAQAPQGESSAGCVIGRPSAGAGHNNASSAAEGGPAASAMYVVGTPVVGVPATSAPNAGTQGLVPAAATGLALSSQDAAKMNNRGSAGNPEPPASADSAAAADAVARAVMAATAERPAPVANEPSDVEHLD